MRQRNCLKVHTHTHSLRDTHTHTRIWDNATVSRYTHTHTHTLTQRHTHAYETTPTSPGTPGSSRTAASSLFSILMRCVGPLHIRERKSTSRVEWVFSPSHLLTALTVLLFMSWRTFCGMWTLAKRCCIHFSDGLQFHDYREGWGINQIRSILFL